MLKPKIVILPLIGRVALVPDKGGAALHYPGGMQFKSNLSAIITRRDGTVEKKDFGSGLVTDAGVGYLARDFANITPGTNDATLMNYHDCGTGITAAAVTQTALVTPAGTARVAGTQTNPTTPAYRTVATISFTSTLAITEWGLFSATTAGTMWDRKVFSAINVVSGDSIQFTYTLTINSGG